MVIVQEKPEQFTLAKILWNRYKLKTHLNMLCFIKKREIEGLKTNGVKFKKGLNMTDKAYDYIANLEEDGMITRDKRKFIVLTEQGEETIKKSFFTIIPDYETDGLLKNFVQYLSSETELFLKQRRTHGNFLSDIRLASLTEELLGFYKDELKNFCRNAEAFKNEVK